MRGSHGLGVVINDGYPAFLPTEDVGKALRYADEYANKGDKVKIVGGLQTDDKIVWSEETLLEYVVASRKFTDPISCGLSDIYDTDWN